MLGERRIGHTGTLDPLATGVLPLVLGRATRLARFLTSDDKRYAPTVRFGVATTTYDRARRAARRRRRRARRRRRRACDAALDALRGTYLQTPPAYSAKKIGGVGAHRLARRGEAVDAGAGRR